MADADDKEALEVLRAVMALARRLRAERPEGAVTLSSLSVLGSLERAGPMYASRLAAIERLQPQSLTRIIAALETGGLIERGRSPSDGRALVIAITERGRGVLAEDRAARLAWLEQAMASALTDAERRTLVAAAGVMSRLAFADD